MFKTKKEKKIKIKKLCLFEADRTGFYMLLREEERFIKCQLLNNRKSGRKTPLTD